MENDIISEGSCGKIYQSSLDGLVVKKIRRGKRKSLSAEQQCIIQSKINQLLCPRNGFTLLFTPRAWRATECEYLMEKIDCSHQIDPNQNDVIGLIKELTRFYMKSMSYSIFPCDYELYLQPDGRIALIDFDKFGTCLPDGSVLTPWDEIWTDKTVSYIIDKVLSKSL